MYLQIHFSHNDATEILSTYANSYKYQPIIHDNGMKVWFGEKNSVRWALFVPESPISHRDAALYFANGEAFHRHSEKHHWVSGFYLFDWETTTENANKIYAYLWQGKQIFTNFVTTINLNKLSDYNQPLHHLRQISFVYDNLLADKYCGNNMVDTQSLDATAEALNSSLTAVIKNKKNFCSLLEQAGSYLLYCHHFSVETHGFNETIFRFCKDDVELVRLSFTPRTVEAFVYDGINMVKVRNRLSWLEILTDSFGLPSKMNFEGTLFESVTTPDEFHQMWKRWTATLCL